MSLRLIQPGASAALRHPKTGALIEPLYVRKDGRVVWPVLGAASDDPDDPAFTDDGGQDEDDEDEDDEEEERRPSKKKSTKSKKSDATDEDDDEDEAPTRPERQAARYRVKLREAEKANAELQQRLKALEDRDKPEDEVVIRDLSEARGQIEALAETNRVMAAQLAFFKSNQVEWIDPTDAFALAERAGLFDDVIDEDGTVDERELRRSLKELAKRKPHLVKKDDDSPKARGRKTTDNDEDEEEEDDEEPRSRRSAGTMNGDRRRKKVGPSREQLAKKFPVLQRI